MQSYQDALSNLRFHKTPYWWLTKGGSLVAKYDESDSLDLSLKNLDEVMKLQPPGTYVIKSTRIKSSHRDAIKYTFEKESNGQTATAMQGNQPTGIYNASPDLIDQIRREEREKIKREMLVEKLEDYFTRFEKLEKLVEKHDRILTEDDDEDGIPDFAQAASKVADIAKTGMDLKKTFDGGLFS